MYNFHPFLSKFPIVLLTIVICFEFLNFIKKDKLDEKLIELSLLFLGLVSLLSFFSGYYAASTANKTFQVSPEVIAFHHNWARLFLFLIIPAIALKYISTRAKFNQKLFKLLYYFLILISYLIIIFVGYLGSELVFSYGAGVNIISD